MRPPPCFGKKRPETIATQKAIRDWTDYDRCVKGSPAAQEGGQDRIKADFVWCMMAAKRGWGIEETAEKLLEVSTKARENARRHEGYALVTARNAAVAAEDGRKRGRG
jgi:hypothetical protein